MEIRQGRPEDYPLLMEQLVQSFREKNPAHQRFEQLFPHVIGDDATRMSWWRLAFIDGKLAAGIELIPQSVRIGSEATVSVGGIGNVHCFPDFRSSGCMSALLQRCIDDMKAAHIPVSMLGGDRTRYGHFGWEYAGSSRSVNLSAGVVRHDNLPPACHACDFREFKGDTADAQRMWAAYRQKKAGCDRATLEAFMSVVYHRNLVTYIDDRGENQFAYVTLRSGNNIAEYAGDTEGVERILRFILKSAGPSVVIPMADQSGDTERMFFKYASWYGVQNLAMIRVNDILDLCNAYRPQLEQRLATWNGSFTIAVDDGEAVTFSRNNETLTITAATASPDITLTRRELPLCVFGPFMPDAIGDKFANPFLRLAFPLPLFWGSLDHV